MLFKLNQADKFKVFLLEAARDLILDSLGGRPLGILVAFETAFQKRTDCSFTQWAQPYRGWYLDLRNYVIENMGGHQVFKRWLDEYHPDFKQTPKRVAYCELAWIDNMINQLKCEPLRKRRKEMLKRPSIIENEIGFVTAAKIEILGEARKLLIERYQGENDLMDTYDEDLFGVSLRESCLLNVGICSVLERSASNVRSKHQYPILTVGKAVLGIRDYINRCLGGGMYLHQWISEKITSDLNWVKGVEGFADQVHQTRLNWIDHMIKLLREDLQFLYPDNTWYKEHTLV